MIIVRLGEKRKSMNKRSVVFFFILLLNMFLMACSDSDKLKENSTNTDLVGDIDLIGGYDEVTEEDVRKHPTTDSAFFEYYLDANTNDQGIMIAEYRGTDTIVVIPEEIDGKPVTAVAGCFGWDSQVQGIFVPNTVKRIRGTFAHNKCLEVVIAEGLERLDDLIFAECPKLHTIILGDSLKEIDALALYGVPALKELYIPKSVEVIDTYALTGLHDDLVFKGEKGSRIEEYCIENELDFEIVD